MRIGVVGATGIVGQTALRILSQREGATEVRAFASSRSAGRQLPFGSKLIAVEDAQLASFEGLDVVVSSISSEVISELVPRILDSVPSVVDNSSAFRMDHTVPLVLMGVNDEALSGYKGIVANPNCTVAAVLCAVAPLAREFGLKSMITTSMQAVSGTGQKAIDELTEQIAKGDSQVQQLLGDGVADLGQPNVYAHPIAFNVIPQCESFREGEDTSTEEEKMAAECRKILGLKELVVHATAVRVPVYTGHSVAISVGFSRAVTPTEAKSILEFSNGVRVVDDPSSGRYPTALQSAGIDEVLVGRIRTNPAIPNGLSLFVSGDNLRRGAALNAIEIAERLAQKA